jgi:hypothetical protein
MAYKVVRQAATKGFQPDMRAGQGIQKSQVDVICPLPRHNRDPGVALGYHPTQSFGLVHPQAHLVAQAGQLAGQAPTHAQIAVVVDDFAKHIPK